MRDTINEGTVGPWLSESLLSEPSIIWTLFWMLKSQKTIWFSAKLNEKSVWFLDLLRLLYHSTADRNAY